MRALLLETLPSVEQHANKRRKGVEKFRRIGNPHDGAERRLSYLDQLLSRIRAEASVSDNSSSEFFILPREMMNHIYNTLRDYSNRCTYEAPRIGGIGKGCPRGERLSPEQLALGAKVMLARIDRDLLGRAPQKEE